MSMPAELTTPTEKLEFLGFTSFPEDAVSRKLGQNPAQILKGMRYELDSIANRLLISRTAELFKAEREKQWPNCFHLSQASAAVFMTMLQDVSGREELVMEALNALEQKFKTEGTTHLGAEASNEALFSIATIKKAFSLLPIVIHVPPPAGKEDYEKKKTSECTSYLLWWQLHIDALRLCVQREYRISPEVLEELTEGLRAALTTYACLREAVEYRGLTGADARRYSDLPDVDWDDEDRMLANS